MIKKSFLHIVLGLGASAMAQTYVDVNQNITTAPAAGAPFGKLGIGVGALVPQGQFHIKAKNYHSNSQFINPVFRLSHMVQGPFAPETFMDGDDIDVVGAPMNLNDYSSQDIRMVYGGGKVSIGGDYARPNSLLQIGRINQYRMHFINESTRSSLAFNSYFNGTNWLPDGTSGAGASKITSINSDNGGAFEISVARPSAAGSPIAWQRVFMASHFTNTITIGKSTIQNNTAVDYSSILLFGKVLISGTTNASSADIPAGYGLAVGNGIIAERFKIAKLKSTDWKDAVFQKDYKLASIQEVESYIKENGHLPEVPSAEEVEANGLDLAKMDATLLQKVEEMTLYIIQLEKRLKEVEGQLTNTK